MKKNRYLSFGTHAAQSTEIMLKLKNSFLYSFMNVEMEGDVTVVERRLEKNSIHHALSRK